ncbi:MAG: CYTH domain-containing protein [Candidatus Dadabacteria bacterium]|nr:CYTH domain-containing protein [Candidatus Dadabacteria bacterium]NIS07882.1 CYTH domain-containing protein [Candidatus Dadabacteria bacterium]NIV42902.1 CYTH domain-containing protein [Candidatus Dadabacteria bacterium]NIX14872.1 CYTH domain-containing protein [Candidatus Dadabacteria bacterium]NIY21486.1 CYTH domain-containing protein [Candidatus Dadabacteria bacterium]
MPKEIERKFLIDESIVSELKNGETIKQGYFPTLNTNAIRARLRGNKGYITIKGHQVGATRAEYEYEIPFKEAEEIIENICDKQVIEKTRYKIKHADHIWEIDVFEGNNKGLIVAEVEMSDEDEEVELPAWIKDEVTNDLRYSNSNLVKYPYKLWEKK